MHQVSLNFATVCRLGGAGSWSAARALDIAADAAEAAARMLGPAAPAGRVAEICFVQARADVTINTSVI